MIEFPGLAIFCPTCGGEGRVTRPRMAVLTTRPDVSTLFVDERCRPCAGTGRIPPSEPDPRPGPDPEG